MIKSRLFLIVALALSLALGLALVFPAASSAKELNFGTTIAPSVIDPANAYGGWWAVRYGIGESPFKLDQSMRPVPWLATDLKRIDDKTWELTLREGVTFQSGRPLTGEAAKKSLERLLAQNARAASNLAIAEIKADGQKLTLVTSAPNPTLPNYLAEPYASMVDVEEEARSDYFVGTGPYKIKSFKANEAVEMVPYENYWGGKPKLDLITYTNIRDGATLSMSLQSGAIDAADRLPFSMHPLFDNPGFKIETMPSSRVFMLYFNFERPFTSIPEVREAISLAIDKKGYCQVLLHGAGTPAIGPFPANLPFGGDKVSGFGFDPAKASQALAKASFSDADGDGILDKDGQKLSLKLVMASSWFDIPVIAEALQGQLREIGVELVLEQVESVVETLEKGDFDLSIYSIMTTPVGDPEAFLEMVGSSQGGYNFGHYKSEKVDKLLERLRVEFGEKERSDLAIQITQAILDDAAFSFIINLTVSMITKREVSNLGLHPTENYQISVDTDISE
ncbi:MAG: ABC transporter substrate-binding protein [Deltaproteobacteria bacterium]|jgi:peptide/nickel transport system substrate-binding protein|nr:ABC transporter substrate-binding protein [Deltaproteobacteria bacterium]